MRVAFYNQMFAMNGRKLFSYLFGHWAVHFQGNEKLIWRMTDINRTTETIKEANPDIIGIAEVLEGQEKELKEKLRNLGYKSVFFEKGHRTQFRKLYIKVCIASKIKCRKISVKGFPVVNKMGGGGGFIVCYFPDLKAYIVNLHLACRNKKMMLKQLEFVRNEIKKLGRKIILMGDFNSVSCEVKSYFDNMTLITGEIKTCSDTELVRRFWFLDLDHIFVRGFRKVKIGRHIGHSDHELIYADLS